MRACRAALATATAASLLASPGFAQGPPSGGGSINGPASPPITPAPGGNPFAYRGMWIWYVADSSGGDLASIIANAHQHGIRTLFIKSGDGTSYWSQFSPELVSLLHANGLRVCAWQFVYGNHPMFEAGIGAAAVRAGADCLVIDAESAYQGKYVQAQTYLTTLRKAIGPKYPVGLAGFPYVDFHPAFPYSVFLGAGGAQYNAPQMYWWDIGTSVDSVYAHTYSYNDLYGRPIYPLGQIADDPPPRQVVLFRQLARLYGAPAVSWWDWQNGSSAAWRAIAARARTLPALKADPLAPDIAQGYAGDLVVWAQEHLISAGLAVPVNGEFGASTTAAVEAFQLAHGLIPDGIVGPQTWELLLQYPAAAVNWTKHGATVAESARAGARVLPVPQSATLPARRDEIPGSLGAGMP